MTKNKKKPGGPFPRERYKKNKNKQKTSRVQSQKADDLIRLNRYIAHTGLCSRREADTFIEKGWIQVNGKKVTELGKRISKQDKVTYKGKVLAPERKTYILLNKPKDTITTTDDPKGRKTVVSLFKGKLPVRVYPVGRLDRMTTGVLLLTNDGELTDKLIHPSYNKKKIYQVDLKKPLSKSDSEKMLEGLQFEDGFIQVDAIGFPDPEDKRIVGVELHSGKNRIIRRIFEHLGYEILKLDRIYFAGLTKKGLSRGRWRFLTPKEISILKRGSFE